MQKWKKCFIYKWINPLGNAWTHETRPWHKGFALNYWVSKGFRTCNLAQTMLTWKWPKLWTCSWSIQKWVFAILWNSILSSYEVVWEVLGHFGKLGMCTTIHLWNANWNSKWKHVKNGLEVRQKSCLKWFKISLS